MIEKEKNKIPISIWGLVIWAFIGLMIWQDSRYDIVCIESVKVEEIVRQDYRTTTIRTSDGKLHKLYSPTIKSGDDLCLKSEKRHKIKE